MSRPTPSDPTGDQPRRSIDVSVVVDATPEEVWQAIATGPGINAWFVPASIEPHEGGKLTVSFGDMGEETAEVTTWDPPHRLVADWAAWGSAADSALELLVEARDGGSCVVRLVHTGFGTGADWDGEYDQTTAGWAGFLHNLKIYLSRFAPQPAAQVFAHGGWAGPQPAAWSGSCRWPRPAQRTLRRTEGRHVGRGCTAAVGRGRPGRRRDGHA
jgi:uncharacterized protein YndB with AHSA1/START domain